jgi:hypothetical protein
MEAIFEYYGVLSNVHMEARVGIAFMSAHDADNNASPPAITPVMDVSAILPVDDDTIMVNVAWFQIALEDVERQHDKTTSINEVDLVFINVEVTDPNSENIVAYISNLVYPGYATECMLEHISNINNGKQQ